MERNNKEDNKENELNESIEVYVDDRYIDIAVEMDIDTKTVVDFLSKKGYEDTEDNIQHLVYLAVGEGIEEIRDDINKYLDKVFREAEQYLE